MECRLPIDNKIGNVGVVMEEYTVQKSAYWIIDIKNKILSDTLSLIKRKALMDI